MDAAEYDSHVESTKRCKGAPQFRICLLLLFFFYCFTADIVFRGAIALSTGRSFTLFQTAPELHLTESDREGSDSKSEEKDFTTTRSTTCSIQDKSAVSKIPGRRLLNACTGRDISITQSRDSTVSGIPSFVVQMYSSCAREACAPSDIHIYCGWFASVSAVNPGVFRRLTYNDCLVNGGRSLERGQILRFSYRNSYMYRLSFRSARFC